MILTISDQRNSLDGLQQLCRPIGAAVIDNDHVGTIELGILHDSPYATYIIIGRYQHTDAAVMERLPHCRDIVVLCHATSRLTLCLAGKRDRTKEMAVIVHIHLGSDRCFVDYHLAESKGDLG